MSVVSDIEDALVAQWSHFGRWPRGVLREEAGLVAFETPIASLPYNGVIRTWAGEGPAADAAIAATASRYRERGVQFLWVVHPSATPVDLGERLTAQGLEPVDRMVCMALELADWTAPPQAPGVEFEEVVDEAGMDAYTELTMRYWEIPDDERELVAEFHRHWGPGRAPGHRYLAKIDGRAIGKGYVSLAGPPGVASIYGMSVLPEERGRGVAGGLGATLVGRAKAAGCERVVLHATTMAVGVYRRLGFTEHCEVEVYGTASLWSGDH